MLWFAFSGGGSWNEGWWVGTFNNYKTDDLHTYGCVVPGEVLTGTEIPGGWGGGVEGWGRETNPDVHYHHHDDSSRAAMARGCPRGCVHNPQLWKREESHSDDSFMVRGRPRGCVHSSQLLKREESHFNVKDYPQGLSTPFEEREPF